MWSDRRIPAAECTEYPWWVIIDPDVIHGLFGKDQRAGRVASAVTGPFLSREAATAQLERRRYAYSANAVVWCMTGHDSSDWRALCLDPADQGALRARAEAAEQRAEAAERELAQARDDARLMLATLYGVGSEHSLGLIEDLYDQGLTEEEYSACDALADEHALWNSELLITPLRRILAAGGAA